MCDDLLILPFITASSLTSHSAYLMESQGHAVNSCLSHRHNLSSSSGCFYFSYFIAATVQSVDLFRRDGEQWTDGRQWICHVGGCSQGNRCRQEVSCSESEINIMKRNKKGWECKQMKDKDPCQAVIPR